MPKADAIVFPRGKTKFIRPDGSVGKSPGHGVALFASGVAASHILMAADLGMNWPLRRAA